MARGPVSRVRPEYADHWVDSRCRRWGGDVNLVTEAAQDLQRQRLLLDMDVQAYIVAAQAASPLLNRDGHMRRVLDCTRSGDENDAPGETGWETHRGGPVPPPSLEILPRARPDSRRTPA